MADEESEQTTPGDGEFDAWIAELRETEAEAAPSLDLGERMARLEQLLERSLGANAALAERLGALSEDVRGSRGYESPAYSGPAEAGSTIPAVDLAPLLAALSRSADDLDAGLATVRAAVSTSQKGVAARLDDLWLTVTRRDELLQQHLEQR